jgi:AraC family transcriptional regulator, melibiose operon regulatory protein
VISFNPARADFAPYGFTCERWTPRPMARPDRHNEVEMNLLEAGTLTYLLGGNKVTIKAGRLALFWAGIPHQILGAAGESEYYVVTIPLAWFLQCRFPTGLVQRILEGHVVLDPVSGGHASDLELLARWEADLGRPTPIRQRVVLLELEARLLRLAAELPALEEAEVRRRRHSRPVVLGAGGLSKVEQMACFVAQHYTDRLTVAAISREVGLHPNYAMNLFQRTFGTTLIDYVTQHRVMHAQRLLATTDSKILEVALSSGFNSLSRFNDAFEKACGRSPREYRVTHRVQV